jgi:glycosyltransferase involved in cell wall biosynthesis
MPADSDKSPVRVALVQPSLASYRVGPFRELARRDGIDLTVHFAQGVNIKNVEPAGFNGVPAPMTVRHVLGHPFYWHSVQLRVATREVCDVVVLNWDVHYLSLVPAMRKARRNGLGVVLWGHGASKHDFALRAWPRNALARMADALVFYDRRTADAAIERGHDAAKVFVASNTLDDEPIRHSREHWLRDVAAMSAFRESIGGDAEYLLFVSRIVPKARLDLLADAVAMLAPRRPRLRVLVVGGGDRAPIDARLNRLGIATRFHFAGAIYDEQQLGAYFTVARAFVYPSGIGLSLVHAMSYGLPVITSDHPSIHGPEIATLVPGENGLLYRDGDAGDLAKQVESILDDPPRQSRLGRNALNTVESGFLLKHMVDGLEGAIRYADRLRRQR